MKVLLIFLLAIFVSGCIPHLGGGNGGVETKPGEFVKGSVVRGFPSLPLYEKAKLIESYGDGLSFGASAVSEDELAKVVNFYNQSLGQLGWEFVVKQRSQTNFTFEIKNNKQQGWIIVNTAADLKTTAITVSVTPR